MADFKMCPTRTVQSIRQTSMVVVCPECHRVWRSTTPQATLEAHVVYFHPLAWNNWLGYKRDLRELKKMW